MAKRRGNNEGSIIKRKSGRWQAQVTIDGERLSKSFDTRSECVIWLREMANRKESGLTAESSRMLLSTYMEQWLEAVKPNLKHKTWEQYRRNAEKHILPVLGDKRISDLRPLDIQKLNAANRSKGLSPRMVQLVHSLLHNALQRSMKWGILQANPAAAVDRPRVPQREMRVLSDSQTRHFLVSVRSHHLSALFRLAITGGLRLGELLGLKWLDVDWGGSKLQISRQLQRSKSGGVKVGSPKTAKSVRSVQLGQESLKELMRHFEGQAKELGQDPKPDDFVFTNALGKPIRKSGVQKAFKKLLESSGLPRIRFHDLRHTAASLMLSAGMPVIQVARQLGHSQPSTTLDVYGHLIPGLDSGAAEKLDKMLSPIAAELQQRENQSIENDPKWEENGEN